MTARESSTRVLAEFASAMCYGDLPTGVRERAKDVLTDALACAVGAVDSDLGRVVVETARRLGSGRARIVGAAARVAPSEAAFANASLMNALDYDDTDATGHPGSSVIAAAVAAAELAGEVSGEEFISALVAGMQVAGRVARYLKPGWERYREVHGSGTAQTLGAVAAAGRVMRLAPERMADAFGVAAALAPVPHAAKFGWEERRLGWIKDNVARAAEGGLRAAALAAAGFVGNRTVLDGPRGFWIMAGSDCYDERLLRENLASFDILELSFKPYPCCRWIHTALDALEQARVTQPFEVAEVEAIEVATIDAVAGSFGDPAPATMVDAEFSMPYSIAALLHGVPFPQWHLASHRNDPQLLSTASKVRLASDPRAQQEYLADGRLSWKIRATVTVRVRAARPIFVSENIARGSPLRPLDRGQLQRKARDLMGGSLGERGTHGVIEGIRKLEAMRDVRELLDLTVVHE